MSKRIYRSSQGRPVDMDAMQMAHEEEIAVGNMKVNARGDELGPGGVIVRTRNEIMKEYYKSNAIYTQEEAAEADRAAIAPTPNPASDLHADELPADILEQDDMMPVKEPVTATAVEQPQLRGSLADAVAKTAKVEQKLLTPRRTGIQRA